MVSVKVVDQVAFGDFHVGALLGVDMDFFMYLFEGLNGGWYYGLYFLSRIFDSYVIKDGIERNFYNS